MPDASDMDLLREYEQHGSEEAFSELVQRHVHLVYSVALRHVRSPAHAEEITQAVFVILARKAASLHSDTVLEGWLYGTTRLASLNSLRAEQRRQIREQEAYMQSTLDQSAGDAAWNQFAPLLDEAMSRLSTKDRHALVLRYFKDKSVRDVAVALKVSEVVAQKRVHRAVEKLRLFFTRRGVAISAAALTAAISSHSIQAAPASLAKTATALAMAQGATASPSTLTVIKGVLKIMAWSKAKTAIAISVGALLATGVAVKEIQAHRTYPWQDMVDGGDKALQALDQTPPQVTIVRSKFSTAQAHGRLLDDVGSPNRWRFVATHVTPSEIVRVAFSDDHHINTDKDFLVISSPDAPSEFYDYIANLPTGSREALQELARKKFGLTGRYAMKEMDVFLLKVVHPGAAGLRPAEPPLGPPEMTRVRNGIAHYRNKSMSDLAAILEWRLQIPVVDQTGLTGRYDLDIPERLSARPEEIRRFVTEHFGLNLESARQPHEAFVIEKVR